jgi:hypothetical protein
MVVQDVNAPTDVIWDRILDFNSYAKMVPKTIESEIYKRERLEQEQELIWVRIKAGYSMLKWQFFLELLYDPRQNSMTWTLDQSNKSDLADNYGLWYIIPHPDNPSCRSRLYYSRVELGAFSWLPQIAFDFITKDALTDATGWVKKYSELYALQLQSIGNTTCEIPFTTQEHKLLFTSDTSHVDAMKDQAQQYVCQPQTVGVTRYALVSSLLALLIYNVHLFFSQ